MAQFNADINLEVQVKNLDKAIRDIESRLDKASKAFRIGDDGTTGRLNAALERSTRTATQRLTTERQTLVALRQQKLALDGQVKAIQRAQVGNQRLGSAVVGGGFPLLFGGGAGAVLGGALGGALGGKEFGFQASIGLSALGTQLDNFAKFARDTGNALKDPEKGLKQLETIGFKVTDSTKAQVSALIEQNKYTEAQTLLNKELAQVIGNDGVKALQDLDTQWDSTADSTARLALLVATELAPALTGLLGIIKTFIEGLTGPEIQRAAANLNPAAFQEAQAKAAKQSSGALFGGDKQKYESLLTEESKKILQSGSGIKTTLSLTEEQLNKEQQSLTLARQKDSLLRAQAAALQAGSELQDKNVYAAQQLVIAKKYELKYQDAINKGLDASALSAMEQAEMADLRRRRDKAIADEAEQRYKAQLNAEKSIYAEQQKYVELQNKIATAAYGEEAGLQRQLDSLTLITGKKQLQLEVERQLALQEAAKNGTYKQVLALYDIKLKNLEQEAYYETLILQQKLAQLTVDKEIAAAEARRPFREFAEARQQELDFQKHYNRLLLEGVLPAEAERLINWEKLVKKELRAYEYQIDVLEAAIEHAKAAGATDEALAGQIEKLKEIKRLYGEAVQEASKGPGNQADPFGKKLEDEIARVKGELNELTNVENYVIAGASAISTAFTDAFMSVVDGSQTAQEALSSFFKSIGEFFLDYAAQVIKQLLVMITLQAIYKALGGASSGGSSITPDAVGQFNASAAQYMAEGGYVTGPTSAIVGEGGEPEYVIPASKMDTAMSRYSAGQRGESLLAGTGSESSDSYTYSPSISATTFGGQDYVTVEQMNEAVREGMAVATKRGTQGGYAKTLGALRNSRSTRARVGIG